MSIILKQEEVNFLIYKYLLEAGLQHTAYSMFYEANLKDASINYSTDIKAGQLIQLLERSLIFSSIENHILMSDYVECKQPMTLLKPHICDMVEKKKELKKKEDRNNDNFILNSIQMGENVLKNNGNAKNITPNYFQQQYLEENCFNIKKDEYTAKYFKNCWNQKNNILTIYEQSKNYIKNIKYLTFDQDFQSIFETESIIPCCVGDKILGVMFMEWDAQSQTYLIVIYTNGIVQLIDINNNIIQIFQLKENDNIKSIHWNPSWNNCLAIVYSSDIKIIDPFTADQHLILPIQDIQIFRWKHYENFFILDSQYELFLFQLENEIPLMKIICDPLTNNILLNESKTMMATVCQPESSIKIWILDQDQDQQNNEYILKFLEDDQLLYYNWCYHSFDAKTNLFVTVTDQSLKIWDIEFGKKKFTKDFINESVKEFFVLKGKQGSVLLTFTDKKLHVLDVNLLNQTIFELDDYPEKLIQINESTLLSYQKEKVVFIEFEKFIP